MHWTVVTATVGVLALQVSPAATAARGDRFAFFQPTANVTPDDRRRLDNDQPVARSLPGSGAELAIYAVVPVRIDGDRLVAWIRRIDELKKSSYVPAIGRLADPPTLDDVNGLVLDDRDLESIHACRAGNCDLKLTASEIDRLRQAAIDGGPEWKSRAQAAFRHIVLDRVQAYREGRALDPLVDRAHPVWAAQEFAAVLEHSTFLTAKAPALAARLRDGPAAPAPGIESFLYWSNEHLAKRPMVSVTEVSLMRGGDSGIPDVVIASRDVFASHYVDASLAITALVRGDPGGPNYLVYLNRTNVDVMHGVFAGLIRWFVQRRLKAEAVNVLERLRQRLESGDPPSPLTGPSPSPRSPVPADR